MYLGTGPDLGDILLCRPIYSVGIIPRPRLELSLIPSLISKPIYLCLLLVLGLIPTPFPLRILSLSLCLCLPCLPHLLRFFLDTSLSLGPCLGLLPLILCYFGRCLRYDLRGGLFRCSLVALL